MYKVTFYDRNEGEQISYFETFEAAAEYWNDYADTPSCFGGELVDLENNEIIWNFKEHSPSTEEYNC